MQTTKTNMIVEAIRENGVLASLREVRAMVSGICRGSEFDAEILKLSRAGIIALHHHDYPQGLRAEQRAELVTDGRQYFCGAALR